MGKIIKKFYDLITKDKKAITLFTTLVNIKCFAFYIFPQIINGKGVTTPTTFANWHFVCAVSLSVFDLLICWGYVHSCVRSESRDECVHTEGLPTALKTANILAELEQGNIVSSEMYSFEYVTKIERECIKGDEIWCITGDLEEDSKNDELGSTINENLKKGVNYIYFITHLGDTISNKASLGIKTLQEANAKYVKKLKFIEINEELIAPDIDIIIYKANHINKRIGFVCVEIGDDQNTYIYQKLTQATLQGIFDILGSYNNSKNQKNIFAALFGKIHKFISYCVRNLSIPYFFISAIILAILKFGKIMSWVGVLLFVGPAFIEFLITFGLMIVIKESGSFYKDELAKTVKNESLLANIVNSNEIQEATEIMKQNKLSSLMQKKGLGQAKEVFCIDSSCFAIWILSDLSYDIANQGFYDWLKNSLNTNNDLVCNILYTKEPAAVGRTNKIDRLKSKYSNRVNIVPLKNISTHYIWSKTHGIILIESVDKQADVYISLGEGNSIYYKKVITTEEESSTLLGRLNNIATHGNT